MRQVREREREEAGDSKRREGRQRGDRRRDGEEHGFTLQMIGRWPDSVMTFRLLIRQRLWRVDGERLQQVLDTVTGAQLHNNTNMKAQ